MTTGLAEAVRTVYQTRPRIFDLESVLPQPLYTRVIEAGERIGANGEVVAELDEAALTRDLRRAHAEGFRSVAVVCLHGYRYPAHELRIGDIAGRIRFAPESRAPQPSPLMKLEPRGHSPVVDAYLAPGLH